MRAGKMCLVWPLFALGVFAMPDVVAEEKKWDGKTFDAKVTVRHWDKDTAKFIKEQTDIPAFRGESKDGKVLFWVKSVGTVNSMPLADSEITDSDGKVWVVVKAVKGGGKPHYVCEVTEKKP